MTRARTRVHPSQLSLWVVMADGRWTKWRGRDPTSFTCIGCARHQVKTKHTYCRTCRERLERNQPVDLDEYVSKAEVMRLRKTMPGEWEF